MNVGILKLWPNEHKNVAGTSGGELKKCWTLELWPGKNNVQWAAQCIENMQLLGKSFT